jgi:hypothetical protein
MLDPVTNFAKVTVSTGYSAVATSIALSSGEGALLPQPSSDGAFNLVWFNWTDYKDPSDDPNKEIVRVTARSSDTITVTRAQEGTTASTKNEAGKTYKMILAATKKMIDDIEDAIEDTGTTDEAPISGSVDDSNLVFQFSAQPRYVVINGAQYRLGSTTGGNPVWTWSAPNVTLAFPVGTGGDIYAVIE